MLQLSPQVIVIPILILTVWVSPSVWVSLLVLLLHLYHY